MRRYILIICSAVLVLGLWIAPGRARAEELRVLVSTFPLWLLTQELVRAVPDVSLDLMIPASAGCPHDYAITFQDMRRLARAHILITVGLGLDAFALDAVNAGAADGAGPRIIDASAGLGELLYQPGQEEEDEDGQGPEHVHGAGVNPHYLASPARAAEAVEEVARRLGECDPEHADGYRDAAVAPARELRALAVKFAAAGARAGGKGIVTQHNAFAYLARDAGLNLVGVIQAHEGQEPSAARLLELNRTIRENKVAAIFIEPQYPVRAGQTLARENDIPLAELDPVASGPRDAAFTYYLDTMDKNLQTLVDVLGSD